MAGWGRQAGGRAARVWAAGLVVVFLVLGITHRDVEASAFAVLSVVGLLATLIRRGLLGRLALGLLALDTLVWMVPATVVNITDLPGAAAVVGPIALALFALGLALVVTGLRPSAALVIGGFVALAATAATVASFLAHDGRATTANATVTMRNIAFHPSTVEVVGGRGIIAVRNRDLFWHTFTVKGTGASVAVPTGARRTVQIDAPPGTYRYVCAIPGHEGAGMAGTMTIT